jgi:hypothetical protein
VERISRSFDIMTMSYRILLRDKQLVVLPLFSMAVMALVVASFVYGLGVSPSRIRTGGIEIYVPLFLFYVVAYAIGIFTQAAVVAGATERIRGGDPTLASALSAAARRAGPIVAWAIVAATVGTVMRSLRERAGILGKVLDIVGGTAWSLATFFIVPVLVFEGLSIRDSFRRSSGLFTDVWGESVVGGATLGLANLVMMIPLLAVGGVVWITGGRTLGLAVLVAEAVLLSIVFSALQGIYLATLYRYATEGWVPAGFDGELLKQAYVSKDGTNHVTLNLHRQQ